MAATSTSWGLGAHKMTADISSPTPVTSPSADSPLRAHSSYSSVVEGPSKEAPSKDAQPPVSSAVSSSVNGKSDGATAAAAAAAAVAAAAKLAVSCSNGVGRAPSSVKDVGLKQESTAVEEEEDGSEAAGTSSDSGDDDDEEEERAEVSKPPERTESESRGAKQEVKEKGEGERKVEEKDASRHHGPVQPKRNEGEGGGNGHAIKAATPPAVRQEVDDHAARASDAATAALAAALASATRLPTSPRPPRTSAAAASSSPGSSSSKAIAAAALQSAKSEEHGGLAAMGAAATGAVKRGGRSPVIMTFRVPQGRDLSEEVEPPDVDRALAAARFVPNRSTSSHCRGTDNGRGSGGYDEGVDGMEEDEEELPLPLPLPTQPMPCMVGNFKVDDTTGVHRCAGTWAMNKSDLQAAARIETRASPFEFKTAGGAGGNGGGMRFPYTGRYQGHFFVRQPPKPVTKVEENELHLAFAKNSAGGWNVEGSGRNVYGPFSITGRLGADRRLEVYRAYAKVPSSKSHRRASSSSHHASPAPPRRAPPSTPVGRMPNRGKHPQSAPPIAYAQSALASAALPSGGFSNGGGAGGAGGVAAMAEDLGLESPAPAPAPAAAGRRVSRTPSYLIKDIGNDGTAHLSHGLRRCVTVLRSLTVVRGKSEWFLEPVDYVALKLMDYPTIIKRPMDLGTVRKKLEGGQYQKTTEFASDVRLVFSNARLYNADPTSLVHTAARELYEMFEAKLAALGPNLDDPPLKRKKSAAALLMGSNNGGGSAGDATGNDYEPERDRKRKNGGSKSGADGSSSGSGGGSGSTSKKQRATSSTPGKPTPTPKPVAAPPPPPVVAPMEAEEEEEAFSAADMPPSMLMMQRKIAEMEAQIQRMQGQVVAQPAVRCC